MVIGLLNSGDEREQVSRERDRLEAKQKRIKYQFREGDIDKAEYQQEMTLTKAALEAVRTPQNGDLVQIGDHIEGLVEAWALATKEERHQLLTMMFDCVYVDMQRGTITGVKPKPEFLPLFSLSEPVRAGETLLVTALLDSPLSPPINYVPTGPKKIRKTLKICKPTSGELPVHAPPAK